MQSAISYTLTVASYSSKRTTTDRFGASHIYPLPWSVRWVLWPAHFLTRYHSWLSSGLFRIGGAVMFCCSAGRLRAPILVSYSSIEFCRHAGSGGAGTGPFTRQRHLVNLARMAQSISPHQVLQASLRAQTYAQFHHRTTQIRYHGFLLLASALFSSQAE